MRVEPKLNIDGFTYIEGGVCAAEGFMANGLNAGINPDKTKNDLGAVYSELPCATACVYTSNKVKGAPIIVTKKNMEKSGKISRAVIVNSKNANTGNSDGEEIANKTCELFAKELNIEPCQVVVASTGVIGEPLSIKPFEDNIGALVKGLSTDGNIEAVHAIMTTDTVEKEVAVEFMIDDKKVHLGGMAKGSGMIHPNMATTLNFVTTDVCISSELLQKALSKLVKITYNCLTIDGDQSTNDMLTVMANGKAGNEPIVAEDENYKKVETALYLVLMNLTRKLAADGEGASKLMEVKCINAPDEDTAIKVAKSVAGSTLFKCAIYGADANWGRILCAIGYADAEFDITKLDVTLSSKAGDLPVYVSGGGIGFSEEKAAVILAEDEIIVNIDMHQGEKEATAWGCDMTHEYVTINGDYRS
ncbi:MAG: bifunctional glutamate N-acetyltransferase/amino-acid acetyltransferase ArgJ [Lachnospiraceae bacterium]|nr:bifunctional glutamate N-acetyltransferase/amino-acid acetyltransferase ArgJ [Lachnospiraceae bacterium]